MTTASCEAVRAADVAPSTPREARPTRFSIHAKSGSVIHSPAYFRSDTERPGDDDGSFGISGEDYAVWLPEAAHFLLSIALHPLDLMISPPWTRMESDGRQTKPVDRSEHGTG